jgi:hypothetical protein
MQLTLFRKTSKLFHTALVKNAANGIYSFVQRLHCEEDFIQVSVSKQHAIEMAFAILVTENLLTEENVLTLQEKQGKL